MKPHRLAAVLLCALALTATAQEPLSNPKFRDRHQRGRFYTLATPSGLLSLSLIPTTDERGAVSGVFYRAAKDVECEAYVSGGHMYSRRVLHPRLHRRPVSQILVPEGHGALIELPLPPSCPVITSR